MIECNKTELVGKYFLSFDGDKLCLQGKILSQEDCGVFFVGIYDWFDNQVYDMRLVCFKDMAEWKFYQTRGDMDHHSERYIRESFKS